MDRETLLRWGRSSWWRSLLWSVTCFLSTTLAVGVGEARADRGAGRVPDDMAGGLWVLFWFVGMLLILLMWWRRRWTWQVAVVTSLVTIAIPIDPLVALVVLMQVWIRCRWVVVAGCTALVTVATFVATWRDTRGHSQVESVWWMLLGSDPSSTPGPFPWWVPVLITLVVVSLFAGIGGLRRELERSRATGEGHRVVAARLSDEVVRQAERERIAREVHDVIGHRLSLLSIHAGALEANTREQDERLAGSASLVRESAAQTVSDLRSLLEVLRRPDDPDLAHAVPGLEALPALVDETVAHGMPLVATVVLDGTTALDPAVGQNAYRVVQELLTNARRHAPGAGVRLAVVSRPDLGVTVEVANRTGSPHIVEGNGLTGLRERVAQSGGETHLHVDDQGALRVAVRLPWRAALAPTEAPT
ncbi:sensor histidine kinase [Janibacter hoylei]|uniref:sensor histidine kinase n=1 Tax=Janibacter hoylei TaxID=364298 RepID=UPI0024935F48|nr:histidine kinase [Janibacter hoylei]